MRMFWRVLLICCIWCLTLVPADAAGTTVTWFDAPASQGEFKKALQPGVIRFPQDLGAHPDYKSEWWYYTGNLETAEGRSFGIELTFFRQALVPTTTQASSSQPDSQWRNPQIYSAHFAVSDIADRQFYFTERFSRGAIGLAGATSEPYHVWLEDWSSTAVQDKTVRLQAHSENVAIDLEVAQTLPPILQGDRGLSIKGREPGNASYYYSLVQQPTQGTITVKGKTYTVTGLTWKDHEYSTSSLDAGTIGWSWFSGQFEDGSALMLYLLRQADGGIAPTSAGTYISADGQSRSLSGDDWQVKVLDSWKSPESGAIYPIKWNVLLPQFDLTLQVEALMPNQELNTVTANYWEGAVSYEGTAGGEMKRGKGYVELTGYAERLDKLF
jgi:predicted secreted hydrolase